MRRGWCGRRGGRGPSAGGTSVRTSLTAALVGCGEHCRGVAVADPGRVKRVDDPAEGRHGDEDPADHANRWAAVEVADDEARDSPREGEFDHLGHAATRTWKSSSS